MQCTRRQARREQQTCKFKSLIICFERRHALAHLRARPELFLARLELSLVRLDLSLAVLEMYLVVVELFLANPGLLAVMEVYLVVVVKLSPVMPEESWASLELLPRANLELSLLMLSVHLAMPELSLLMLLVHLAMPELYLVIVVLGSLARVVLGFLAVLEQSLAVLEPALVMLALPLVMTEIPRARLRRSWVRLGFSRMGLQFLFSWTNLQLFFS